MMTVRVAPTGMTSVHLLANPPINLVGLRKFLAGLSSEHDIATTTAQNHEHIYNWETPEISMQNAEIIRSAFSRTKSMPTETINSLFIKYAGSGQLTNHEDPLVSDLLLDLLHSGAEKGSRLLRALIYSVYEYFQKQLRPDLYDLKPLWMFEAEALGW